MRYRLKLIITIILLVAISFGTGGTLMIATSFYTNKEKETKSALAVFQNTQNTLQLLNSLNEQTDFQNLIDVLSQMERRGTQQWLAIRLCVGDGAIYSSGGSFLFDYDLPTPEENQCCSLEVSDDYGHGFLVKGIMKTQDKDLEIIARFDLTPIYALREAQQKQYLIIYIVVLALGAATAVAFSFILTRHLHQLTMTVRQITGGDLSKRSRIRADDEIGQLSRDFDAMADSLQETISKLETDMQRQESFMGAFAHELKTPMTSIIGFADLLRQGNMNEIDQMLAAGYIYSEGHRLERLSFKLLDLLLLKKDSITMKQVSLGSYVSEIQRILAQKTKSQGINLIYRVEEGSAFLEPDLVKSLVYNLVDNACKAMDGGGTITLAANVIADGCQFRVEDTGRGMEAEELTKITDAFYRVDKARARSQGGAGLGLTLCKQIAQLHNGNIHFASQPGKGTIVTVNLYGKAEQGKEEIL